MAKRLRVSFHEPVGASRIDEHGQAKPCALGVGWVNPDTLATLGRLAIKRTDAKGRPLEDDVERS